MIRTVLDTNVFMSGIFWSGSPAKILEAWKQHKIKIVFSHAIMDEYIRVGNILAKKYPGIGIMPFIDLVMLCGELFLPIKLPNAVSEDPDDDKFIATALAANCNIIVSGDKDLL